MGRNIQSSEKMGDALSSVFRHHQRSCFLSKQIEYAMVIVVLHDRVILGVDSSQRVMFPAGLSSTVTDLELKIKKQCMIKEPFQLQFMDTLFGNEFMNLTSMEEHRSTIKILYTSCEPLADLCEASCSLSTSLPDDTTSSCGDSIVILSSPEPSSLRSSWPGTFVVP